MQPDEAENASEGISRTKRKLPSVLWEPPSFTELHDDAVSLISSHPRVEDRFSDVT